MQANATMKPMPGPLRGFVAALASLWTVLLIAAVLYSRDQNIPQAIAIAVVPAFLLEAGMYLASGIQSVRERLERLKPEHLALLLTAVAPVPYSVYTLALGLWDWHSVLAIAGLAAVAAFWYVLLPRSAVSDLTFLGVVAAVTLLKVFVPLYPSPVPKLALHILGTAMWVRTGILAVLAIRRMEGIGFSFVPRALDWAVGLRFYLYFMPIALVLAWALRFVSFDPPLWSVRTLLLAVGTFLGMLWVVALSEEFFFRGVLQQVLGRVFGSEAGGLILASVLFGLAHLPFRAFPNWRFAILAGVAGLFYGGAFLKARSIRAAMVTHALVNTSWRVLLS